MFATAHPSHEGTDARGSSKPPPTPSDLWRDYRATGERAVRDRLVLMLAPLVRHIVFRGGSERPVGCDANDLVSCGLEALIGAIERYDPAKGATLEQFAWTRIRGAVLDERRRQDWAPRAVRRWEREIALGDERLRHRHGRRATDAELAAELDVGERELDRHRREAAAATLVSLNAPVRASEGDAAIERIDAVASQDHDTDPERATARSMAKDLFRGAFARLPDRERQIAVLLYVQERTLREIGEILGVTESRVCQLHGRLKRTLREELHDAEPLLREVA